MIKTTTLFGISVFAAILLSTIALAPQVNAGVEFPDKLTKCQCVDLSVQDVDDRVCFDFFGNLNTDEVEATCNTVCQDFGGFNGFIGVSVNDLACTVVQEVDIDLKPQSCPNPVNVLSKGLVPVAILGTAEFDVNDIVISSLPPRTIMHTIEDVATPFGGPPLIDRFSCTEDGPDGFDDLIFKIPSSELNCLPDGVLASLTIDGVLLDGTGFEGSDVAFVINKKACP